MVTKKQRAILEAAKFNRTLARINNTEKRRARQRKNAAATFKGLGKFFNKTTSNLGRIATNLANSKVGANTKINI